jgi:hypothetical protein
LAQKYRQKIAENYDGGKITVLDILTAQTNKQQWIEETKKELANKEAEECTFHPMTNENVQVRQDESIQSTGDKCFDLYQLSKTKKKEKIDKTREEYDFEKSAPDCTFQPNINKDLSREANKQFYVNQKSIQDNLERMKKAREDREFKKKMTERGYGEPSPSAQPMKKQPVRKPMNYARPPPQRRVEKVTSQATDGGSLRKHTERKKEISEASKKRRSAAQRSMVAKDTASSRMKKASKVENQREVRVKPHRKFEEQVENVIDPEKMYKQIEEEEKDIRNRERFENDNNEEEYAAQFKNQEQIDIEDPNQSPEYDQNMSPDNDNLDGGNYDESPEQEYNEQDDDDDGNLAPEGEDPNGNPLLFVDVNLGPGRSERIVVYEGDTAEKLADEFTQKHGLDENLKEKLVKLLENQIAGLLARIDEELTSNDTEQ